MLKLYVFHFGFLIKTPDHPCVEQWWCFPPGDRSSNFFPPLQCPDIMFYIIPESMTYYAVQAYLRLSSWLDIVLYLAVMSIWSFFNSNWYRSKVSTWGFLGENNLKCNKCTVGRKVPCFIQDSRWNWLILVIFNVNVFCFCYIVKLTSCFGYHIIM